MKNNPAHTYRTIITSKILKCKKLASGTELQVQHAACILKEGVIYSAGLCTDVHFQLSWLKIEVKLSHYGCPAVHAVYIYVLQLGDQITEYLLTVIVCMCGGEQNVETH